jgi:hypothetical protein
MMTRPGAAKELAKPLTRADRTAELANTNITIPCRTLLQGALTL